MSFECGSVWSAFLNSDKSCLLRSFRTLLRKRLNRRFELLKLPRSTDDEETETHARILLLEIEALLKDVLPKRDVDIHLQRLHRRLRIRLHGVPYSKVQRELAQDANPVKTTMAEAKYLCSLSNCLPALIIIELCLRLVVVPDISIRALMRRAQYLGLAISVLLRWVIPLRAIAEMFSKNSGEKESSGNNTSFLKALKQLREDEVGEVGETWVKGTGSCFKEEMEAEAIDENTIFC